MIASSYDRASPERQPNDALRELRTISETCHFLRDIALPLLWRSIRVRTVSELGRLLESLDASPGLAFHVRSFAFAWELPSQLRDLDVYPSAEGTLLDLAFRDRGRMWELYAKTVNAEIEEEDWLDGWVQRLFYFAGKTFYEPVAPNFQHSDPGEAFYDPAAPKLASGPDGNGEDALIKTADQLVSTLVNIVAKLPSVRTFMWSTSMMPMPMGVLNALEKLPSLKSLHVEFGMYRNVVHARE